ncbi:MAG: tetratricopeptide repeat protein [Wolinella sp.]
MSFFKAFVILFFGLFFGLVSADSSRDSRILTKDLMEQNAKEDFYIIQAFSAVDSMDYVRASEIFERIFKETNKPEYLYEAAGIELTIGRMDRALALLERFLRERTQDEEARRMLAKILSLGGRYDEALSIAKELLKAHKSEENYLLVSSVYFEKNDQKEAIKYLESAYEIAQNPQILDQLSSALILLAQDKVRALTLLETHTRIKGCTPVLCMRLAELYREKQDLTNLEETFRRLYEMGEKRFARNIVEIMLYKKDFARAIKFLEESGSSPETLLDLYRFQGEFSKAQAQAKMLYETQGDIKFLGLWALFEYEGAEDKNDPRLIERVQDRLERYLKERRDHLFLNFLGYLLIDHNLNAKRGITLVEEALSYSPDLSSYIDSLAWGHYRLGDCQKAREIIERIPRSEMDAEDEMGEHYRAILKCLEQKKSGKK